MHTIRALFALIGLTALGGPAAAVEEPPHTLALQDGPFEIRDYGALAVAEVTVGGSRNAAGNSGFRKLAAYIFGGNARKQSIEMTAPVVEAGAGDAWVIRFVMPKGLSLDALPKPDDEAVRLREAPATRFAVVRFSGLAGDDAVAAKTAELEAWLKGKNLSPTGPPVIAQYDPPWTLWFMRRNEIMIPIRP